MYEVLQCFRCGQRGSLGHTIVQFFKTPGLTVYLFAGFPIISWKFNTRFRQLMKMCIFCNHCCRRVIIFVISRALTRSLSDHCRKRIIWRSLSDHCMKRIIWRSLSDRCMKRITWWSLSDHCRKRIIWRSLSDHCRKRIIWRSFSDHCRKRIIWRSLFISMILMLRMRKTRTENQPRWMLSPQNWRNSG